MTMIVGWSTHYLKSYDMFTLLLFLSSLSAPSASISASTSVSATASP